jgi:hypothetical protein
METNRAVDNETNNTDLGYFCGGKRRGGREGTCRRRAGSGTSHVGVGRCKVHGGSTRSHVIAAERKIARHTANIYGIPRHIDPGSGLIEEYWRTAGIVAGLDAKVASLKEGDVVWGQVEIVEGDLGENRTDADGEPIKPGRTVKSRAGLNIWVKLFNEERDRYTRLGEAITRLGLEARRDEYIRAQVEVFAGVLLSPDLALTEGQRQTAGRLLRALESQKVIEGEVAE